MGISAISLFETNKHIEDLAVYLLGENISDENKSILWTIAQNYGRRISIIDVPELDIPDVLVSTRWPLSAFTRLFSGQLLPKNVHKVLYLDCDTIVRGDISHLSEIDVSNYICCGIKDCIGSTYKQNIGLKKDSVYINAGVLLFNLNELRKIDIKTVIDKYMAHYLKLINYADQDILNGIFCGKVGVLESRYGVMTINVAYSYEEISMLRKPTAFYSKDELAAGVADPAIIHYTTNMRIIRPWFSNTNHPLASEFRKYMEMSPWKDKKLNEMIFDTKAAKVIGVIDKLPSSLSRRILGLIHSELKPLYIRFKATKSFSPSACFVDK
jgi:lipopolysaccharide biosynthesis glycosyltransferase